MKRIVMTALGLSLMAAALSAFGEQASPPVSSGAYVITVATNPSDTVADLENLYQAKAEVFRPESGFAVLSTNNATQSPGVRAVEVNLNALSTPESRVDASGTAAWSSGSATWSSGWNSWVSGWNSWVSGNTVPGLPAENNAVFRSIALPQAHALSRKFGEGIKVAVIDTGVDLRHPGIKDRLSDPDEWRDFVDNDKIPQDEPGKGANPGKAYGHGTAVAGIILQIAPKATILPLRALTPNGGGDLTNVIKAIDYAIEKGALIINLSLGSNISDLALSSELTYAKSKGVYVFASAGNNGKLDNADYPARLSFVEDLDTNVVGSTFGIGSVSRYDELSSFTASGDGVFAFAPGERIYSFYPDNKMTYATGTSFAVPMVSGAFALAASELPSEASQPKLAEIFKYSLERARIWERYYENLTPRPVWVHGRGILDVQRMILNLPDWSLPSSFSQNNLILNPGFETGNTIDWLLKGVEITQSNSRTGLYAIKFLPTTDPFVPFAEKKVTGLKPNTTYTLLTWFKSNLPKSNIYVCLRAYYFTNTPVVADSSYLCAQSQTYHQLAVRFATDASHTSVIFDIYYTNNTKPANMIFPETYIDDFMMFETPNN
jgi:thermitase